MPDALKLLTLKAPAPAFDASKGVDGLPQRILIMPWGEHDTAQGKVICNETTLKTLAAYNAGKNWDRPALDFEHNSVPGSPTYKGEPVKVAGYGTLQIVQGAGIYLLMSSWTQEGKDYAAGGHYGDLSPVVQVNAKNEIIGCHSAALCRHGATPGVLFLSAVPAVQHESSAQSAIRNPQSTIRMSPEELMKALTKALGLAETATAEEILTGLTSKLEAGVKVTDDTKTLSAQLADLTKERDALKLLTASQPDTLKALSTQLTEQGETLKTLSATLEASQRGEIIASAVRAGKAVPGIAKTLPLDQLKQLCAELPVTVPMEKRAATEEALMLSSAAQNSPEADAVSKQTGVSAEDRAKYANR